MGNLDHRGDVVGRDIDMTNMKTHQLARIISDLKTNLETIQVQFKYMLFDIECLRREHAELKKRIEEMEDELDDDGELV